MPLTNTHFRKRVGKLWTFISDSSGIKTHVDYILIRYKQRNSAAYITCEAYSTFSCIGSDHRIITATIRLSLIANTKQNKRINYDWSTLKDPKLRNEYSNHVNRIYDQLITTSIDNNITASYNHFIGANEDADKQLILKK